MSYPHDPAAFPHDRAALERLHHRWGWIVFFGITVALCGLASLALAVWATIISVVAIAILMVIAGGSEIAMGLASRDWGHFFLWIIAGLFYIVAGSFALAQPLIAATVVTLMLGFAMLATGVIRIYFGLRLARGMRGMVIFAGAVTFLVGLLIVLGWPANSLSILGLLLGVDLLFWGTGWIAFGLKLRPAV